VLLVIFFYMPGPKGEGKSYYCDACRGSDKACNVVFDKQMRQVQRTIFTGGRKQETASPCDWLSKHPFDTRGSDTSFD